MAATTAANAREALREAIRARHELLSRAICLAKKSDTDPTHREALERSSDATTIFWLESHGMETIQDLEAIELFVLLTLVDYPLWRELARELWPGECDWIDFFETRSSLRVGVSVYLFDEDREVLPFNEFVVTSLRSERSESYKEAYRLMELLLERPLQSLPAVPVLLCFMVSLDGLTRNRCQLYRLDDSEEEQEEDEENESEAEDNGGRNELGQLLTAVYEVLRRRPSDNASVMRVTHLKIVWGVTAMDEIVLAILTAIRKLGVQMVDVPTICLDVGGRALRNGLRSFRSLMDANDTPHESPEDVQTAGVEEFYMSSLGAHLSSSPWKAQELVPSAFSALQASRSLRRMHIDFDNGSGMREYSELVRHRMVWWMTYALFCRSPLEKVDLNTQALRVQDIEWMAQIWNAPNPLAMLFPEEAARVGTVLVSRVYLERPQASKMLSTTKTWIERAPVSLEIIGQSRDGYLPVLLPGWGKAWVKQENDTIISSRPIRPPEFKSPTHLLLRRAPSYDTVLALARLVGRDLKFFTIHEDDGHEFRDSPLKPFFGQQLLRACPHLEELHLPGPDHYLQAIVDGIYTGQNAALQRISVRGWVRERDGTEVRFLEALSNPRDTVAKQLRKVRLYLTVGSNRSVLEAALVMLRQNKYLREVGLFFRCDSDLVQEFEPQFKLLRLSPAREPLPERCVLAFLSAVHAGATRSPTSGGHDKCWEALEQFDSRILSLVVDFASSPHTRVTDYRVYSSRF